MSVLLVLILLMRMALALIDGCDLLGVDAIDVISAKTFNVALVSAIVTSLSTRDP